MSDEITQLKEDRSAAELTAVFNISIINKLMNHVDELVDGKELTFTMDDNSKITVELFPNGFLWGQITNLFTNPAGTVCHSSSTVFYFQILKDFKIPKDCDSITYVKWSKFIERVHHWSFPERVDSRLVGGIEVLSDLVSADNITHIARLLQNKPSELFSKDEKLICIACPITLEMHYDISIGVLFLNTDGLLYIGAVYYNTDRVKVLGVVDLKLPEFNDYSPFSAYHRLIIAKSE